jgi:hypothetical protein
MSLPVKNAPASCAAAKDDAWHANAGVSASVEAAI